MNFISTEYALFLPLVLVAACFLSGGNVIRLLFVASLFFYGWWSLKYLLIFLFMCFLGWWGALALEKRRSPYILWAFILANLSFLYYFKYLAYTVKVAQYAGGEYYISAFNFVTGLISYPANHWDVPNIILPIGISFHTFQTVAYLVDVYRGDVKAEPSLARVTLFLSFFPLIVAGPIERASHLIPQLYALETGRTSVLRIALSPALTRGLFMILRGVFVKFVIADNLSVYVDEVYATLKSQPDGAALMAMYFFSIQIYCDFYGYTLIALGSASLFGVDLINNFDHPYLSANIQEFWRKWHISLSRWVRDYVYIPLGGSRVSSARSLANLVITMLLVGIWHGASFRYALWGALHGAFLAGHRVYQRLTAGRMPGWLSPLETALGAVLTFHMVTLAWIPFRAPDRATTALMWDKCAAALSSPMGMRFGAQNLDFYLMLAAVFLALELADKYLRLDEQFARFPVPAQAMALFALLATTYFGPFKDVVFIYFQF